MNAKPATTVPPEATPKPSAESTRERLLAEAARQFAQYGYAGASLRKLAAAVGIQAGSIFHHFPDGKQQLYHEIRSSILRTLGVRLEELRHTDLLPAAAIEAMCALFWDFFAEYPPFAALILQESFELEERPAGDSFEQQSNAIIETFAAWLDEARTAGDIAHIEPRSFMFWITSACLVAHGAPGLGRAIFPEDDSDGARQRYMRQVRRSLLDQA